ncbi:G-type lectin S-receptor-like serine/threonine-protein kinase SD2-5 [Dioscorea cayenensis subsp. rotundata]|uniref:non-specific serine/threonine protein kinase n=1 Tax=Dioscorea cayennensis subsp. rotundata TaxID=55577 RepID=A0AB40AUL9_DIOCR|nr:G-type lectin S-receptor-like serine/threonine-protein kinase SD2-5 [Dioscorea cayenensis subsp. rotundata]
MTSCPWILTIILRVHGTIIPIRAWKERQRNLFEDGDCPEEDRVLLVLVVDLDQRSHLGVDPLHPLEGKGIEGGLYLVSFSERRVTLITQASFASGGHLIQSDEWEPFSKLPINCKAPFTLGLTQSHLQAKSSFQSKMDPSETNPCCQNNLSRFSRNGTKPVKENATLELKKDGNFVLTDINGTIVWSTITSGKPVSGINLTDNGEFDVVLIVRTTSFGTLLISQLIHCCLDRDWWLGRDCGFSSFIESDGIPQVYYRKGSVTINSEDEEAYLQFMNGNVSLVLSSKNQLMPPVPPTSSPQFLRLDPDGHLRLYQLEGFMKWKVVADLLDDQLDYCDYPLACGYYGVCSNKQCSCPQGGGNQTLNYFSAVNYDDPVQGCTSVTPLDCQKSQKHHLLHLENVYYFHHDITSQSKVSVETCKAQCLTQCGCKAVGFCQNSTALVGSVLLDQPTLLNEKELGNPNIATIHQFFSKFRKRCEQEDEYLKWDISAENYFNLNHASELPVKFCFEDLRNATHDFSKELGRGGSGSVFEGILSNGRKVAVKRMERISQGKKQFLAEIETIHGIHHINLVRLIGYCVEKSYYFLVYEFMSNGSLDKWIFNKDNNHKLDWGIRLQIIINVAKGLSYLHEDCCKRILHLDIMPQNILLDENFNAKIADFGLSKLVERDQSKVMTTMRGTLGYLAPEWLNSVITEKVDVYSFGILVLEIICGRKNFDFCQPIEDIYLLKLVKEKAHDDRLHEIVAKDDGNMELHMEEAVKMIRVAMWCLQSDHNLRPAMSKIVKVLEDGIDINTTINYEILIPSASSVIDKLSHPFFNSALLGI